MKNKKVKQSICDALNHKENRTKRSLFMWVWMEQDSSPCRICFRTCNFMWQKWRSILNRRPTKKGEVMQSDWEYINEIKKQALNELLSRHKQSRAKISSQCDTLISKKLVEVMIKELD